MRAIWSESDEVDVEITAPVLGFLARAGFDGVAIAAAIFVVAGVVVGEVVADAALVLDVLIAMFTAESWFSLCGAEDIGAAG